MIAYPCPRESPAGPKKALEKSSGNTAAKKEESRKGGRVAEGTTLLTWRGIKPLESSNLSLSAVNEVSEEGGSQLLGFRER